MLKKKTASIHLVVHFDNHQDPIPIHHPFSTPTSLVISSLSPLPPPSPPCLPLSMKRPLDTEPGNQNKIDTKMKKKRYQEDENEEEMESEANTGSELMTLDENLLFEVLKHVDARTLGSAACVSKQWHRTVQDERLWELICTRHWGSMGCGNQQLRSVVLALGGFRRLHSQYLWPLSKPPSNSAGSASTSSAWNPFSPMIGNKPPARWGKDEVHLSLSLLSIRYYEKMNFSNRGR